MDLNFIDNSFILKYHLNLLKDAGINSARAVGWHSRASQLARFEALTKIGDMTGCSILDVGCGIGDLRAFIAAKYAGTRYTGIDMMEHFITAAAERYHDWPDTTFLFADIADAALPAADYVLVSGALSYHHSEEGYLYRMIQKLYDAAHKALAFNLLNSLTEPAPVLCVYEPETILNYCRTISDNVQLVQGYLDGDFMVKMGT